MIIKIIKKNKKSYIQLPEMFNQVEEVELFQLKDTFWLLSSVLKPLKKIEESEQEKKKRFSDEEGQVLQKLMKIKFVERTPLEVEKTFSKQEKIILQQLVKKGFVWIFYGKKYKKTGVYNISDAIYPLLQHEPYKTNQKDLNAKPENKETDIGVFPNYATLLQNGWLILSNSIEAEQFSLNLKRTGLAGNVRGVRGFDKRFYIATPAFIHSVSEKIKKILEAKKAGSVEEIAQLSNLDAPAVSVVLHILCESGELVEKKRGLFCLA